MRPPLEPALADLADRLAAAVGLPGAGLRGARPAAPIDGARWLELAREHDVAPLLAARPGAIPRPAGVDAELAADLARWGHEAMFRAAELGDALAALAPVGEVIVLKGPALAAAVYADASERVTTDLDLLVRDAPTRRAAIARLTALGYAPRDGATEDTHDLPLDNPVAQLEIDLHVDLTRPPLPPGALADAWARRVRLDVLGGVDILDPVWRALHAAVHALADPIGSPLLRNLLEVGWLTAQLDAADRAALIDRAHRFGLADRAGRALALAHRLFGSPAVLGRPRAGAREAWAWWRLGRAYGAAEGAGRVLEHVAEYHLRRLDRAGSHDRDPRPLLATLADVAATQAAIALRRAVLRLAPAALEAAPARTAPLPDGEGVLVHALDTDDVHVLAGDAITAWRAATPPAPRAAMIARLAAAALPAPRAAAAVDALVTAGLLVPAR